VRHIGRVACRVVQRDGCLIYFLEMHPRLPTPAPMKPWLKSDLLFLELSLQNGMALAEIAGFLARNEKEVREKAVELRRALDRGGAILSG
jgi:hypothetical protein